jgi:hypothetical protein
VESQICSVLIVRGCMLPGFIVEGWKLNFNASWRLKNVLYPNSIESTNQKRLSSYCMIHQFKYLLPGMDCSQNNHNPNRQRAKKKTFGPSSIHNLSSISWISQSQLPKLSRSRWHEITSPQVSRLIKIRKYSSGKCYIFSLLRKKHTCMERDHHVNFPV